MKKKNGLLLISALGALILSGCSLPGMELPNFSEIMNNQESESSSQKVEASYSKESSKSSAVSSRTPTPSSSSSSNAASSSKETINVFEQYGLTGTYYSSLGYLFIRSDGVVSFNERTNGYPATVVGYGNGLYHIASDSSVPSDYKFDIYTDGVIAYVTREGNEYLFGKNSNNESPVERIQTFNGSLKVFGIQLSYGNEWNFIAIENGVVYGYADVFVIKGKSFNTKDSVFKMIINESQRFFTVTSNFIVETQLTESIYDSWNGELIVYKHLTGEFLIATLNGQELDGATMNGNIISVPNTSATLSATYDDIVAVTTIEQYVLNNSNNTFTTQYSYNQESIVHEMVGNSGTCSGTVGADGHLWAKFNFPYDGILEINETIAVAGTDSYLYLYEMGASQSYTNFNYAGYIKGNYNTVSGQLEILGGVNYLIKIGNYYDRNYGFTSTSSQYNGCEEAFEWNYLPNVIDSFSGSKGDIEIVSRNNSIVSIKLDGVPLNNYTIIDDVITKRFPVYNSGDSTPIPYIATYTLDRENNTYTYSQYPESSTYPFGRLDLSGSSYSGVTDSSGNMWVMLVPSQDGYITINGVDTDGDYAISIYDLTSNQGDLSSLTDFGSHSIANDRPFYSNVNLYNVSVKANHAYVIKYGYYSTSSMAYGGVTEDSSYINAPLSFNYTFTPITKTTYFGDDGELTIYLKGSDFDHATLNGSWLSRNCVWEDNTLTIKECTDYEGLEYGEDHMYVSLTTTVFTVNNSDNSYVKIWYGAIDYAIHTIFDDTRFVTGFLGKDGNMWASFTPSQNGYISIDEVTKWSSSNTENTILAVYEKKESGALWSDYSDYRGWNTSWNSNSLASNCVAACNSYGGNLAFVRNVPVEAGKTYIIKIGAEIGDNYYIGHNLSEFYQGYGIIGSTEEFNFRFYTSEMHTYSGSKGDLELTFLGDSLTNVCLEGETVNERYYLYDESLNALTIRESTDNYVLDDPLDPYIENTDGVYELDSVNWTYSYSASTTETHLINEIEAGVEFTGVTGKDGCYYAKFTAPSNGTIKIQDLLKTYSSEYVIVYENKPGNTTANYYGYTSSAQNNYSVVGYTRMASSVSETKDLNVEAGKTYVIKVASGNSYNKVIGNTNSLTYVGKTGTILLTFTPAIEDPTPMYADGIDGRLEVFPDGSVSLDAIPQPSAIVGNDGKTVFIYDNPIVSYDEAGVPSFTREKRTYTISDDGASYTKTVETEPFATPYMFADQTGIYNSTTMENGLFVLAFVAPTDGNYTIDGLILNDDAKIGIYTDYECTTLVYETTTIDRTVTNRAETITFDAQAGQIYYIKIARYNIFNTSVSSTTTSQYANREVSVTITLND